MLKNQKILNFKNSEVCEFSNSLKMACARNVSACVSENFRKFAQLQAL